MNVACLSMHNGFKDEDIADQLERLLSVPSLSFHMSTPKRMKRDTRYILESSGWTSGLKVPGSNLKIGFFRERIGMSIQLGNVSRTYADLLKLQTMYSLRMLDAAVIAVPTKDAADLLGSNHASYERLNREIRLFSDTITVPILVLGLGG